jgi:hypothetical protein
MRSHAVSTDVTEEQQIDTDIQTLRATFDAGLEHYRAISNPSPEELGHIAAVEESEKAFLRVWEQQVRPTSQPADTENARRIFLKDGHGRLQEAAEVHGHAS